MDIIKKISSEMSMSQRPAVFPLRSLRIDLRQSAILQLEQGRHL